MKPTRLLSLAAIASLSALLVSCNTSLGALKGEWIISEAMGMSTNEVEKAPFIRFNGKNVSGNAGVNSFFGDCKACGSKLSFGDLAMTKMMGPHMDVEDAVTEALGKAASAQIDGSQAVLKAADGTVVMVLKKQ